MRFRQIGIGVNRSGRSRHGRRADAAGVPRRHGGTVPIALNGVTAATTRRRTAGMLAVAAGAALIVSACASTEHAAARQAQAPLLARAAEHFNQAAADADRAAVYLDRAAGTMLAINGVKPAHVQGFSESELSLRYVAHVLREAADTLPRARLPLSREQSRNMLDAVREMRSASSFVRGHDRMRELLTDLRTEGQELPADDAAAVADAVEDIESALDSVESMIAHTAAAATELERLAEAPP